MSIGIHMDVCAQQATCRKVHFSLVHEEFLSNLAWKARGKQQMAKLVDHGEVLPRVLGMCLCTVTLQALIHALLLPFTIVSRYDLSFKAKAPHFDTWRTLYLTRTDT